jgi:hypothetical protein
LNILSLDVTNYIDGRIIIKGCSDITSPAFAMTTLIQKLQPIAARIGPKVSEVATVLPKGGVPKEAQRCPAFVGLTADE